MVSNLVTIVTNYFGFYKLVSISWFSCSDKRTRVLYHLSKGAHILSKFKLNVYSQKKIKISFVGLGFLNHIMERE